MRATSTGQSDCRGSELKGLGKTAVIAALVVTMSGAAHEMAVAATAEKSDGYGTKGSDDTHLVDIGAITFSVETPRHTQYVVTKISVAFLEASDARHYGEVQNVVRLRDAVLTVFSDTNDEHRAGAVDLEQLGEKLQMKLIAAVPELHNVNLALLGTRNVPRR